MVRVAVFASGNGSNFEALFHAKKTYEIACLIVDDEQAHAISRAKRLNVPFHVVSRASYISRKAHEEAIYKILKSYDIHYICLAGYMRILTDYLIENFQNRILNIHPSLLPSFPGRHAIKDALSHGVKVTGVTVFYVDCGIDTGKIIAQEVVGIEEGMTQDTLEEKIHQVEHRIYSQTLEKVIGGEL